MSAKTPARSVSSPRRRQTVKSAGSTLRGGRHEEAPRFLEREEEPAGQAGEDDRDDATRRLDHRLFQETRRGDVAAVPGPDQPVPRGLRGVRSSSRAELAYGQDG